MDDAVTKLAIDLDTFEYDYDYYGYMDMVDDRQQAVEDLKNDLMRGLNIGEIIEHLTEIINEHEDEWGSRANDLLHRVTKYANIIRGAQENIHDE